MTVIEKQARLAVKTKVATQSNHVCPIFPVNNHRLSMHSPTSVYLSTLVVPSPTSSAFQYPYSPRKRLASRMSLTMMVTRFA